MFVYGIVIEEEKDTIFVHFASLNMHIFKFRTDLIL